MNEIVPKKLIINLNQDGTFRDGILQYQIRRDGVMPNKFYTMGINSGISLPVMNTMLTGVKERVEIGEKFKTPEEI